MTHHLPMCNGDHGACGKFTPNSFLYPSVSLQVHTGSGFIDADHSSLREESSSQTDELTLTHGEHTPLLFHFRIQATFLSK